MRHTRAIIHHQNLRHNLKIIQSLCPGSRLCLAVKANAYGHGAVAIAQTALQSGVYALGVATANEAFELRREGIQAPIILYGIPDPSEIDELIRQDIELFCTDTGLLQTYATVAKNQAHTLRIHIKVDTGMGRIGCQPHEIPELAQQIKTHVDNGLALELAGVCTHFPVSEDVDPTYTEAQIDRFLGIVAEIRSMGLSPQIIHAANSGAIALHPRSHLDMARPGIMAYGYAPGDAGFSQLGLKPVMEVRSVLTFVKRLAGDSPISYGQRWKTPGERWIGTVAIGYADGIHRAASGKLSFCEVGVEPGKIGRTFEQVGTICMDQCMVDLGPATAASPQPPPVGTEMLIFGAQKGAETAHTIGQAAGTIAYEICCGISARLPRVHL